MPFKSKGIRKDFLQENDLFRQPFGLPPSPEGEGFWMHQPPFLFPVPCSLFCTTTNH